MNTKAALAAVVLSAVTLAVLIRQSAVTPRYGNVIELYLDDRCLAARDACVDDCRRQQEETVGPTLIDESFCKLGRHQALRDCQVNFPGGGPGHDQCRADAESAFTECMAPINQIRREAAIESARCQLKCRDQLAECRENARDALRRDRIDDLLGPERPDEESLNPRPPSP